MSETLINQRYRWIRVIGEGGMGKVWQAEDVRTGRMVAIKQLHPIMGKGHTDLKRFKREARLLRQLDHPNIIKVLAFFEERDRRYLVMPFMEGGSLYRLIEREGPLPVAWVRRIGLDLCDALTRAHSLGAIHRDIKPENILLDREGKPILTDFGLARLKGGAPLTQVGFVVGSACYISPEVCQGLQADERADIWGLGVVFYEMLTGESPFLRRNSQATVIAIIHDPLPPPDERRPDLPVEIVDLLKAMLQKDPNARIASAAQVAAALRQVPDIPDDRLPVTLGAADMPEPAPEPADQGAGMRYRPFVRGVVMLLVVVLIVVAVLVILTQSIGVL